MRTAILISLGIHLAVALALHGRHRAQAPLPALVWQGREPIEVGESKSSPLLRVAGSTEPAEIVANAPRVSQLQMGEILREGNSPPRYPQEAERQGWEGTSQLGFRLGEGGQVVDVQLVRSSGFRIFDEAAIAAAMQWRFPAAYRVEDAYQISVEFRLEQ